MHKLLFFICLGLFAFNTAKTQNYIYECSELVVKNEDRMTGRISYSSANRIPFMMEQSTRQGFLTIKKSGRNISLFFQFENATPCIDKYETMYLLLRDGTRIRLLNDNSFNCNGVFWVWFENLYTSKRILRTLAQTEIEAIRFSNQHFFFETDLSEHQSKTILHTIQCMQ